MNKKAHTAARAVALAAILAVSACSISGSTASSPSETKSGSIPARSTPPLSPAAVAATSAHASRAQEPAPSSGPAMTVSQQQAIQAAQQYLSTGSGFSYNSLLGQLTSSYGNGFSQADATFAIGYLQDTGQVDWDQQAVDAAQGYMQMGGFSRESLIQQLTSSYGNGFTESQAEYAAAKVGL